MKTINAIAAFVSKYLIFIMIAIMIIAYFVPAPFLWIPSRTTLLLSMIMFCMGMTLDVSSFKAVAKNPKAALLGLVLQFTLSPLLAYLLVLVFNLPAELAIGFILLGSTPGGTASNVMAFIAEGDVALTVSMTAIATLIATFVTPLLVLVLAGQYTEISFMEMLMSVLQMVMFPVVLGIVMHQLLEKYVERWMKLFVLISSVSILMIVGGTLAKNGAVIVSSSLVVVIGVIIHNFAGYGVGYGVSRLLGATEKQARSVTFQVGMKNTGLAISLGTKHFSTLPMAVVPAAVGMVIHQITGPILANLFLKRKIKEIKS